MALTMRDMGLAAGRPEGYPGALRRCFDRRSAMGCRGWFQTDVASESVREAEARNRCFLYLFQVLKRLGHLTRFSRTRWGPAHVFLRVSGRPGAREGPILAKVPFVGWRASMGLIGLQNARFPEGLSRRGPKMSR